MNGSTRSRRSSRKQTKPPKKTKPKEKKTDELASEEPSVSQPVKSNQDSRTRPFSSEGCKKVLEKSLNWRVIDDFCLMANVMHFNDLKMAFKYSRLCRSFTLEEVKARYHLLCFEPDALQERREEIRRLSDEDRFDVLLNMSMNPAEALALSEIHSTMTVDIGTFKKLLEGHRKVFHQCRTPEILHQFWLDMNNACLLKDQKVPHGPMGNIVLTLSDCSDVESENGDSSTVDDSADETTAKEGDQLDKVERLKRSFKAAMAKPAKMSDEKEMELLESARIAHQQHHDALKMQIRSLSIILSMSKRSVGPESELNNCIVEKGVLLRVGFKCYAIKKDYTKIGIDNMAHKVDIDLSELIAPELSKRYVGILANLHRRPSGVFALENCLSAPTFVDGLPIPSKKSVVLYDRSLISIAGVLMHFELDACSL